MKKIDLSLILPCYNEAEHILESVPKILKVLSSLDVSYEIIFVEDRSTDTTKQLLSIILEKYAKRSVKVIWQPKNSGRGYAVTTGINKAHGNIVGYIDLDLEVDASYIPLCVSKIQDGYDVVCGWRIYDLEFSSILRTIVSTSYRLLSQIILNHSLHDTEAGYKFFRKKKIEKILLQVQDRYWFWDTEIMLLCSRFGLKIYEQKVKFVRRKDKTSTVKLIPDTITYLKKLWEFRNRK